MRTRSVRELKDYLYRKTRPTIGKTGQARPGISAEISDRVQNRLVEKGYVDDQKFARFWVENRYLGKGISRRKLTAEMRSKGVDAGIIDQTFGETERSDTDEIQKIIAKKRSKYPDDQKLIAYLARQGFSYDDIKQALASD